MSVFLLLLCLLKVVRPTTMNSEEIDILKALVQEELRPGLRVKVEDYAFAEPDTYVESEDRDKERATEELDKVKTDTNRILTSVKKDRDKERATEKLDKVKVDTNRILTSVREEASNKAGRDKSHDENGEKHSESLEEANFKDESLRSSNRALGEDDILNENTNESSENKEKESLEETETESDYTDNEFKRVHHPRRASKQDVENNDKGLKSTTETPKQLIKSKAGLLENSNKAGEQNIKANQKNKDENKENDKPNRKTKTVPKEKRSMKNLQMSEREIRNELIKIGAKYEKYKRAPKI